MNVLERVQGCNRIIVQGHREMETQRVEGKGFQSVVLVQGGNRRGRPRASGFERQLVIGAVSGKSALGKALLP